jgi:N-methylhydantoinase B
MSATVTSSSTAPGETTGPSIYRLGADAELDPITYEILRHRLWEINSEQAVTIMKVSPSPVASEAQDFNVILADGDGEVCYVGPYVQFHGVIMDLLIKRTIETRGSDVGVNPGDMFLTNDPYVGAAHHNDVAVLAPFFHEGEILAWTGSMLHNVDIGGINVGGFCIDATDTFSEPIAIPPVKVVDAGRIRGDFEEMYLRQSRTPEMLALDLRAQIAANNVAHRRLQEVVDRYGPEAVAMTFRRTLDETEAGMRKRLTAIPDGEWRYREFIDKAMDGDRNVWLAQCTLRKQGDELVFDVRGSDPQIGHINLTRGGLRAGLMFPIIQILGWDLPWASSAMLRCITIESTPGTIMDAVSPACVSAATLPAMFVVENIAEQCVCTMLSSSEEWEREVVAQDSGSWTMMMIHGANKDGTPYQTMLMDPIGGGVGARSWKDGVDSGGVIHSPSARMVDLELNELLYPILYLFRREATDSGGPGEFRGGSAVEIGLVPHDVERINYQTLAHGVTFPNNVGLAGGLPGAAIEYRLTRSAEIERLMASGELPQDTDPAVVGGETEWPDFRGHFVQERTDVFFSRFASSGGFGDPLDRVPGAVAQDVESGHVSGEVAREVYGVVLGADGAADEDATGALRAEKLRERLTAGTIAGGEPGERVPEGASKVGQLNRTLSIYASDGPDVIACERCRTELAANGESYKNGCREHVAPITSLPYQPDPTRYEMDVYLELRRYCCPGCGRQLCVDLARPGEPIFHDVDVVVAGR